MKKNLLIIFLIASAFIIQANFAHAQHLQNNPQPFTDVTQHLNKVDASDPAKIEKVVITSSSANATCYPISSNSKIYDIFDYVTCLLARSVMPLLILFASAVFAWGVTQYILNAENEAKREKGKQFMIWGLISLFVIVSIWGLVHMLAGDFGLQSAAPLNQTPQ